MEQLIQKVKEKYVNEKFQEILDELSSEEWKFHPELAYWKGMTEFKLRNIDASIEALDQAIKMNNSNPDWYSDRAMVKFWEGKNRNPLPDLDKAVSLQPEYSYRYGFRAFVKQKLGQLEAAVEDYEMALALDSEDEICRNNLELARQDLARKQAQERKLKEKKRVEEESFRKAMEEGGMESKEFLEFEQKFNQALGNVDSKEKQDSKIESVSKETDHQSHQQKHSEEQNRQGLTASNILWVMKRVFTNKEERKRFFNWISKK